MTKQSKTQTSDPCVPSEYLPSNRSIGSKVFLGMLGGIALLYAFVVVWHISHPLTAASVEDPDFLERCRQY